MSRLDEIKARAEQVHWTSTSIEQVMARMASSANDVPWLLAEVARLTAERDAAIERLERVIDQWRKTGRVVISEMDRADKAEAERDALAGILAEFVDSEPCSLDHHGYCQSHGHFDEGECHMARARAALAGSEADTSDTQPTDPGCGCSTNPARARYADGDPAGCYCTCSDDAREGCEHEPDEPQPTGLEVK